MQTRRSVPKRRMQTSVAMEHTFPRHLFAVPYSAWVLSGVFIISLFLFSRLWSIKTLSTRPIFEDQSKETCRSTFKRLVTSKGARENSRTIGNHTSLCTVAMETIRTSCSSGASVLAHEIRAPSTYIYYNPVVPGGRELRA